MILLLTANFTLCLFAALLWQANGWSNALLRIALVALAAANGAAALEGLRMDAARAKEPVMLVPGAPLDTKPWSTTEGIPVPAGTLPTPR